MSDLRTTPRKQSARQAEKRQKQLNMEPQWITPKSGTDGKLLLKARIDAFFQNSKNEKMQAQLRKEYKTLEKKHNVPYPTLLELVIDKMKAKSVRRVRNHKILQNFQKAQFLEPYKPTMDEREDDSWEKLSESSPGKEETRPDEHRKSDGEQNSVTSQDSATDPVEKIEKYCKTMQQGPPKYNTTEQCATDGTPVYVSVITHETDEKIYGAGSALTKEESIKLAAKEAVEMLERGLKHDSEDEHENDDDSNEVEILHTQKQANNNTSDNAEQTSSMTDSTQQSEETINTNMDLSTLTSEFDKLLKLSFVNMKDTIKTLIKPIVEEVYEEVIIAKVEKKCEDKMDALTMDVIKTDVKNMVDDNLGSIVDSKIDPELTKRIVTKAANELSTKIKKISQDTYKDSIKPQLEEVIKKGINDISTTAENKIDAVKDEYNQIQDDLSASYDKFMEDIEDNVGEGIENIVDVTNNHAEQLLKGLRKGKMQSLEKDTWQRGDEVAFADEFTGVTCNVNIVDIHDNGKSIGYTIGFKNGKRKKVSAVEIQPKQIQPSKRLPNVDVSLLQPQKTRPARIVSPSKQATSTAIEGPSSTDLVNFHKQFRPPLKSDGDIINFYNQLKSQGRNYNIQLIDLTDITPDCDLCPDNVNYDVREKMALAIYQKMQDDNVRDVNYSELTNCLEQFSSTSDGYETLAELLRRVHPNLQEGRLEHTLPKLSECDFDLFKLNKSMRDYFTNENIKNRHYSDKEMSRLYLQSIDDDRYNIAVHKCLVDISIATMESDTIKQKALRFNSLPTTVKQIASLPNDSVPTIRAFSKPDLKPIQKQHNRGAYNKRYEPCQCIGCGRWGHRLGWCPHVPTVATSIKHIEKNKAKTATLVESRTRRILGQTRPRLRHD